MSNDDDLTAQLRAAYRDQSRDVRPPAGLAATVRRRHVVDTRRRVAALIAAPVVAATATAGTIALVTGSDDPATRDSTSHVAEPSSKGGGANAEANTPVTYRLAGYTFVLPSEYHALSGSCSVPLPDGSSRQGTPGAEGGCITMWVAAERPSWLPPDLWRDMAPEDAFPIIGWDRKELGRLRAVTLPALEGTGRVIVTSIDIPPGSDVPFFEMLEEAENGHK